jgi:RecA-family ATPase
LPDEAIEFAPDLPFAVAEAKTWYLDAADLLAEPDPGPTAWLVDDLIVDRALVAAVGRWKTTKSYGLLDLCIAVATGRPAFGKLAIPRAGPVVFVNEESGRAALWRRLDALCRGRAVDPEELRGRLYVAANSRVKLDDAGWQNDLLDVGRELSPRLFVFDPLARMKGASRDESAQKEMGFVVEFWRLLREETGAAVCLVHHTGHQGDHMRGSSDLESAWETRLAWKREGQSPLVTIESEHREAESGGSIKYRIAWDGLTRSMRFELEPDELVEKVAAYLGDHPEASANKVYEDLGGKRSSVLEEVRRQRQASEELAG